MTSAVMWFRRDLRLSDHPRSSRRAAAGRGGGWCRCSARRPAAGAPAGATRRAFLSGCLRALDEVDRRAPRRAARRPGEVVARPGRRGRRRRGVRHRGLRAVRRASGTSAVEGALAAARPSLVRVGSPVRGAPRATVVNGAGEPYKVFTPFSKAWRAHGWPAPGRARSRSPGPPASPATGVPDAAGGRRRRCPSRARRPPSGRPAGSGTATSPTTTTQRDRPGARRHVPAVAVPASGAASTPGSCCAEARRRSGAHDTFRTELCWREFYADVLHHRPETARRAFSPAMGAMEVDGAGGTAPRFEAWCEGRTGYPIVDAGMRQLVAEGWMHNRVRMIVASFLVKDLHLDWTRGARYFMRHLVDGDLASNQHGWQWVAGTGTDAAPYFRIFNPVTQGERFDPDGAYVRRWVPELADVAEPVRPPPVGRPGRRPPDGLPAADGRPRRGARGGAAPLRRDHRLSPPVPDTDGICRGRASAVRRGRDRPEAGRRDRGPPGGGPRPRPATGPRAAGARRPGDPGGVVVLGLGPPGAHLHPHGEAGDVDGRRRPGRGPALERRAADAERSRSRRPARRRPARPSAGSASALTVWAGRPFFITMGVTQASWAPAASSAATAWARASPVASSTLASSSTTGWPGAATAPAVRCQRARGRPARRWAGRRCRGCRRRTRWPRRASAAAAPSPTRWRPAGRRRWAW